jgi:hypothetical protein
MNTYTLVVKTEVSVVGVDDTAWHATLELGVGDAFDEGDHGFTGLTHVVRLVRLCVPGLSLS